MNTITTRLGQGSFGQRSFGQGSFGQGSFSRRIKALRRDDDGMATAEYAVGTVAACGFGGILYKVLTSEAVGGLLSDLVTRALSSIFG